eukprot:2878281-Amphidinium_carterae.5
MGIRASHRHSQCTCWHPTKAEIFIGTAAMSHHLVPKRCCTSSVTAAGAVDSDGSAVSAGYCSLLPIAPFSN